MRAKGRAEGARGIAYAEGDDAAVGEREQNRAASGDSDKREDRRLHKSAPEPIPIPSSATKALRRVRPAQP